MKQIGAAFSRMTRTALQAVFPPVCACCDATLFGYSDSLLCQACHDRIEWLDESACSFCGSPAGKHAELGRGCANCSPSTQAFTRATAVAIFGAGARDIVWGLKFSGIRRLARPMAAMMVRRMREAGFPARPDLVLPVPLHPKRLAERGFNQAGLLAREIARDIAAPICEKTLVRNRHLPAQAKLTQYLRERNLAGAFSASGDLAGATALLVDDVLTTGTTASECARALRDIGAKMVYVVVFAR